ncbi:MAG TPA: Bax inhibitor-1 family protein [Kofleriaceae bacterium]
MGAVATVGVSDRVAFLRRTYGLLGIALVAFAALTAGIMRYATGTSIRFSSWAWQGGLNWLLVIGLFMLVGYIAQGLARSPTSRGLQIAGLGLAVVAQSAIMQPLLWTLIIRFGNRMDLQNGILLSGSVSKILGQAVITTLAIFIGLTATVFISRKDFSFMRGMLTVGMFAALGVIIASMAFGFSLGAFFCGAMVLLMAGYILYQTSLVMNAFPPTAWVAASLMLFSTIATLFWYVLQLLMSLNRR